MYGIIFSEGKGDKNICPLLKVATFMQIKMIPQFVLHFPGILTNIFSFAFGKNISTDARCLKLVQSGRNRALARFLERFTNFRGIFEISFGPLHIFPCIFMLNLLLIHHSGHFFRANYDVIIF